MVLFDKLFGWHNLRPYKTNRIKFHFLLVSLFVCCIAQFSFGQGRENELDSFVSAIEKNGDISGSVLVAEKWKDSLSKIFWIC
jgi:hypothetical protein